MPLLSRLLSWARPSLDKYFPLVATAYRDLRDQLELSTEPTPTPWGFKLAGHRIMARGEFEPIETELIRKILTRVDVFVNVGANVGYYCCHALSMGKQVIAFEPISRNSKLLCKNIDSNGWTGAEIYPIALSDQVGIVDIYGGNTGASIVPGWAGTATTFKTQVPSSTMDTVLGSRLHGKRAMVLIDAEGAEQSILRGARGLLSNDPALLWVVEIVSGTNPASRTATNEKLADTFGMFFDRGFKGFTFDLNLTPVTHEQVALASKGLYEFPTHNFVFFNSRPVL